MTELVDSHSNNNGDIHSKMTDCLKAIRGLPIVIEARILCR